MTPNEVREIIRDELRGLIFSDRYIFQRDIEMLGGRNFQFSRGTGTKHGTAANQKQSFYGVTPIVQPTSASQAIVTGTADGVYSSNEVTLINDLVILTNQLRADLIALGLIKGS